MESGGPICSYKTGKLYAWDHCEEGSEMTLTLHHWTKIRLSEIILATFDEFKTCMIPDFVNLIIEYIPFV